MADVKAIDNKAVVRRFIEQVVTTGNLEVMAEFVAEDIIDHNLGPEAPQGIEVYKEHLAAVRQTYGNFRLTIQRQIAEGELVVTQVTATGTHQNEWLGLKPTGKQITLTGINIDRVVGGKQIPWALFSRWGLRLCRVKIGNNVKLPRISCHELHELTQKRNKLVKFV